MTDCMDGALSAVYDAMLGSEVAARYSERHGIEAQAILTIHTDRTAGLIAEHLAPRVAGKTVVEIGGGIGLLALHLGQYAKRVYCIEANPMWSSAFVALLLKEKPRNVSFLFGAADEFLGCIRGDVAIYVTHSGVQSMGLVAAQFAPETIDVWGELLAANPDAFDADAAAMRQFA